MSHHLGRRGRCLRVRSATNAGTAAAAAVVLGLLLLLLPVAVHGQGPVFACCAANATVTYGTCDGITDAQSLSTADELAACWAKARAHFRNNTLDPALGNVTIASQYQFFMLMMSSANPVLDARALTRPHSSSGSSTNSNGHGGGGDYGNGGRAGYSLPLTFSAAHDVGSRVEPVQSPGLGLRIIFSFPQDDRTGACAQLELRNWAFEVSLDGGGGGGVGKTARLARPAVGVAGDGGDDDDDDDVDDPETVWGLGLYFSGCGRDQSVLGNLSLSALGYGLPAFSFLTVRDSQRVVAIEASQEVPVSGGPLSEAMLFTECIVKDSWLGYFGDVDGTIGGTSGLTQNGSFLSGSEFAVVNPRSIAGWANYQFRNASVGGDSYTFTWLGTFTGLPANATVPVRHIENSRIQYIGDIKLGSVNATASSVVEWPHPDNPAFDPGLVGSSPPLLMIYSSDATMPPASAFGSAFHDCNVSVVWQAMLLRSRVTGCTFSPPAGASDLYPSVVPDAWLGNESAHPSFVVDMDSFNAYNGFPQGLDSSTVCLRRSFVTGNHTPAAAQQIGIANDTNATDNVVGYC